MIKISNQTVKTYPNFWNHCVFHPTDAVEDAWGRRILDKMAEDKAIDTVRIYTMFEDIVYIGENGELCYDFRVSDLRLDYLLEKGYNLMLAYAGIPDCIASSTKNKTTAAKNKTRYKGKMWNTSPPADMGVWEDMCYEYTKHIVERYGLETVKKWHCHCFNEPDIPNFFFSELDRSEESENIRCAAYCQMYEGFVKGIGRVSKEIMVGGPALAHESSFLGKWLDFVKERNLKVDFISVHSYGTSVKKLNSREEPFCVESLIRKYKEYDAVVRSHGFAHLPIIVDEWGMSSSGFFNRDECPDLMARETELFSAYFAKLIYRCIEEGIKFEKLMICLSGQHEMVVDFSGFRNFFTLNFIKKPIYNAYILSTRLGSEILDYSCDTENVFVIPTKTSSDAFSVMITYSSEFFEENIPSISEKLEFDEDVKGKKLTVWRIDRNTTNPYRTFEKMGVENPDTEQIAILRQEGLMKPVYEDISDGNYITLDLTPNSTYLVTVE